MAADPMPAFHRAGDTGNLAHRRTGSRTDVPLGDSSVRGGLCRAVSAIRRRPYRRIAAEPQVEQNGGRDDRHDASGADVPADLSFFEIAHDALRRVEPVRAAAGEDDRVDLVHHVQRVEQIRLARPRRAAALRHTTRRAVASTRMTVQPVGRSVSV